MFGLRSAGIRQTFGHAFGKRPAKSTADVQRMCGRKRAGHARPAARRTRGAPRFGAMRRDGRIARAQPTACAGK
ncbi:hypothetical protein C7270_07490 [Burkholderia thailandensis]|nr:hypothetical protein [Burkholderia thailandensis]